MGTCRCDPCSCPPGQPGGGTGTTGGAGGGTGTTGGAGGGAGTTGGTGLPVTIPPIGTWLLIRYDAADMGARPIPGSDNFWVSPDIWLTGGDANGNPIGGQPATLFARIWNLGSLAAAPVRVDFSFIEFPATGIPPTAPQLIGTGWGSVPALSAQVIQCPVPWHPPVGTQDIHSCLIVTCSAPLQGDTPTVPGSPVADRHTGQRNYTVVEGTAGQQFPFSIRLANLGPVPAAIELLGAAAWHTTAALHQDAFLFRPSLSGALSGAADYATASHNQLWARRAALLDERSPRLALHPLPASQVTDAITVT